MAVISLPQDPISIHEDDTGTLGVSIRVESGVTLDRDFIARLSTVDGTATGGGIQTSSRDY